MDMPESNRQKQDFSNWLVKNEPNRSVPKAISVIEGAISYCAAYGIQRVSLWEIDDPALFEQVAKGLCANPLFRAIHRRLVKEFKSAYPLYKRFLQEKLGKGPHDSEKPLPKEAENIPSQNSAILSFLNENQIPYRIMNPFTVFVKKSDTPVVLVKYIRRLQGCISVSAFMMEGTAWWRIRVSDPVKEGSVSPVRRDATKEQSAAVTDQDVENKPSALVDESTAEVASLGESDSDHKDSAETPNESKSDPLLAILKEKHIRYVDMRPKNGRLWLIGDSSLMRTAIELGKMGYPFLFIEGGSKSTKWKSAWFLNESKRTVVADKPEIADDSTQPSKEPAAEIATLSPDLLQLLSDEDMSSLRNELIRQGILTLAQFKAENPWVFMNRHALYPIAKRQEIYSRIMSRINNSINDDPQSLYRLCTKTAVYPGKTPSEAFARYCEKMAQQYPLKFRSLINTTCMPNGTIVLYKDDPTGDSIKLMNPEVYISKGYTVTAAIYYALWLCNACGDNDLPNRMEEPAESSSKEIKATNIPVEKPVTGVPHTPGKTEAPVPTTRTDSGKPAGGEQNYSAVVLQNRISKAEKIVLDADLDGITIQDLSANLQTTMTAARTITDKSDHIILLGNKYYHDEAFVDWEEGADKLESILDRLMAKSDGYVTASRLYEYARSEMQIFLNDNDLDDPQLIYDMARFLFEKQKRHGKEYSFRAGMHISKVEKTIDTFHDLVCSYAENHDGFVRENELAEYFVSLGLKPNNLRNHMRLYSDPVFFFYDIDHDTSSFLYAKSMHMDEEWFASVRTALRKLFDDMGDHVILRDIQPWWFSQLPGLPGGRPWTLLLLQSIVQFYSKELDGVHTISALTGQSSNTIHAMIVSKDSEVQNFADAVAAFLIDGGIEERAFEAEELRQMLVRRGMAAGNELIWNMHKALANDSRFIWDAEGRCVNVKV